MDEDLMKLKEYLIIDKDALDDEVIKHSSFLSAISEAYEDALSRRDAAKERMAVVDADLDIFLRDEAEKNKLKLTESVIKSQILMHTKHTSAFLHYQNAKLRAGKLGALKEAFKERGYMLRELCGLYIANYYERDSVQGEKPAKASYQTTRKRLADARKDRGE